MIDYKSNRLPKKHFSTEQIAQFRKVNLAGFMNWYQPGSIVTADGSYRLKENRSVVLNDIWARDFSAEECTVPGKRNPVPGLDAVMQLCGLNFFQAACAISDFMNTELSASFAPVENALTIDAIQKRIETGVYEKAGGNNNIFAYLTQTRLIDSQVVKDYLRNDNLYVEPLPRGYNLLFPMYDTDGEKIVGFERCGILSNQDYRYKGSIVAVANSYFQDWLMVPIQSQYSRVIVFESAIDAMSFRSLVTMGKVKVPEGEELQLLSLRGVHYKILQRFLEANSNTNEIVLAVDADAAGDKLCGLVAENLGSEFVVSSIRQPLVNYGAKDWNELLSHHSKILSAINLSEHCAFDS